MALWNEPVDKYCPVCGHIMVKKTYKNGTEKILCSNAECPTLEKTKRKKSAAAGTEEKSGKEEGR